MTNFDSKELCKIQTANSIVPLTPTKILKTAPPSLKLDHPVHFDLQSHDIIYIGWLLKWDPTDEAAGAQIDIDHKFSKVWNV